MSEKILGINVDRVTTTQEHELGVIIEDVKGGDGASSLTFKEVIDGSTTTRRFYPDAEYQYVKAGSAISAGNAVIVDVTSSSEPYVMLPSSAAAQPVAGIAETAIPSGSYGWIKIKGRVNAATKTTGTVSAGNLMVSSSTAGALAANVTDSNITSSNNILASVNFAAGVRPMALDSADSNNSTIEVVLQG